MLKSAVYGLSTVWAPNGTQDGYTLEGRNFWKRWKSDKQWRFPFPPPAEWPAGTLTCRCGVKGYCGLNFYGVWNCINGTHLHEYESEQHIAPYREFIGPMRQEVVPPNPNLPAGPVDPGQPWPPSAEVLVKRMVNRQRVNQAKADIFGGSR
jgi:hypothetical protein